MDTKSRYKQLTLAAAVALTLVGCSHGDDSQRTTVPDPVVVSYEVTITNLTQAQPLSPVAIVLHSTGNLWQVGEPASISLEKLAEAGDTSDLLADASLLATASGTGLVAPGMSETISINVDDVSDAKMSLVSMLVNTNDAFTGLDAYDLSLLSEGQSVMFYSATFDAGTEENSEAAGTIPGPADGGVGFDSARDDVNFVAMHPGVLSADDGLAASVLAGQHKFDNPTTRIRITRIQ